MRMEPLCARGSLVEISAQTDHPTYNINVSRLVALHVYSHRRIVWVAAYQEEPLGIGVDLLDVCHPMYGDRKFFTRYRARL